MFSVNDVKILREKTGAGMLDCKKALEEASGNIEAAIDWLREKGIAKAAKKGDRIAAEGLTKIVDNGNTAIIIEINSETDFVAKNEEFINAVDLIGNTLLDSSANSLEEALEVKINEEDIATFLINLTAKLGEKINFRRFARVIKKENEAIGSYSHMGGRIGVIVVVNGSSNEVAKDVGMHIAAMRPLYINKEEVEADVLEKESKIIKEQAINEGKPADIAEKMVSGRILKFYKEICLVEQPFVKDGDITVGQFVSNNNGSVVSMIRFEVGEGIAKKEEDFASEVMNQIKG